MDLGLKDKLALITASSGGIGFEIAQALAREGTHIIINGRNQSSVDIAIQTIKKQQPDAVLHPLVADNGTALGTQETITNFPDVDILVNNLGVYEFVGFFEETDGDWLRLFEINILSGVRLSRHYLRRMLDKKWGRVLFISSEQAVNPWLRIPHYIATKAMQLSIARSLADLTKGSAVTVNAVLPGTARSDGVKKLVRKLYPTMSPEEAERQFLTDNRRKHSPDDLLDPREIASLAVFLCSTTAASTNGASYRADGNVIAA
ncbi:SDR family oxidoreductase [Termitidicoccus mucosus]|uniref:3-oxoacyl-ACP reductase n=1 Tax=Termitidicoccus mucosus TaxID=1184151 RepID=A0A178IQD6_9BACT|nr:3-oxoacyl-ACP reductase [Opitutaceae bacterium TSB47]